MKKRIPSDIKRNFLKNKANKENNSLASNVEKAFFENQTFEKNSFTFSNEISTENTQKNTISFQNPENTITSSQNNVISSSNNIIFPQNITTSFQDIVSSMDNILKNKPSENFQLKNKTIQNENINLENSIFLKGIRFFSENQIFQKSQSKKTVFLSPKEVLVAKIPLSFSKATKEESKLHNLELKADFPEMLKAFPLIENFFKRLNSTTDSKFEKEYIEKIEKKKIFNANYNQQKKLGDFKTHLGHFIVWFKTKNIPFSNCYEIFGNLDLTTSFLKWFKDLPRSWHATSNKAKVFLLWIEFLQKQPEFKSFHAELKICEREIRDFKTICKRNIKKEAKNRPKEAELIKDGKFLSEDQWKELYQKLIENCYNFINNFHIGEADLNEAFDFQSDLIVLCHFMTGQRSQISHTMVISIDEKTHSSLEFDEEKQQWGIVAGPEKQSRSVEDFIPIPSWLGYCLDFFQKNIRRLFFNEKKFLSIMNNKKKDKIPAKLKSFDLKYHQNFWVGIKGGFMRTFSSIVSKRINFYFPDTHVTPDQFRRLVVTHVMKNKISKPNQNPKDFLTDFAKLLNTSTSVMFQWYDRSNWTEKNIETSEIIGNLHSTRESEDATNKILGFFDQPMNKAKNKEILVKEEKELLKTCSTEVNQIVNKLLNLIPLENSSLEKRKKDFNENEEFPLKIQKILETCWPNSGNLNNNPKSEEEKIQKILKTCLKPTSKKSNTSKMLIEEKLENESDSEYELY